MTRRNNEERLGLPSPGAKEGGASPVLENNQAPDSLLSYVNPTELVDLPSEGKFYGEAHPLYNKPEVELREMTAKEEDILTSKSLIHKGVVLDRLLQSLIVDKSINIDSLLIGDKNALLVAARIGGYGSDYNTNVTCPGCSATNKHAFDLSACNIVGPLDLEAADDSVSGAIQETEGGRYIVKLPKTGIAAEVRLLTGKDEKKIVATQEMKKKRKLPENPLTEQLKTVVVSLNGVEGLSEVSKCIDNLPASDCRFLRSVFTKITPNIDMTQEFVCDECGHEQDVEVPFTADFFWPDA